MGNPAIRFVMAAILLVCATSAFGQMYKWVDKNGKTQYTDQPPPQDAKQKGVLKPPTSAGPPSGDGAGRTDAAQSGNRKGGATQDSFRPEEQTALRTMCAIHLLESFSCHMDLKKHCSLEELVAGIGGNPNKGLKTDPRQDPNYEYRVQPRGDESTVAAIPRRPGLSGFLDEGNITRFNMNGPARGTDQKIEGGLNCAGLSK